jgi:hypothetical protein
MSKVWGNNLSIFYSGQRNMPKKTISYVTHLNNAKFVVNLNVKLSDKSYKQTFWWDVLQTANLLFGRCC